MKCQSKACFLETIRVIYSVWRLLNVNMWWKRNNVVEDCIIIFAYAFFFFFFFCKIKLHI